MAKKEKIRFNFDAENDVLFIYNSAAKSEGSIEYGKNIHISFAKNEVVGLEIMDASQMLSALSKTGITMEDLSELSACSLSTKKQKGLLVITFTCRFKQKLQPLENYLTLQDVTYNSPLVATV